MIEIINDTIPQLVQTVVPTGTQGGRENVMHDIGVHLRQSVLWAPLKVKLHLQSFDSHSSI